MPREDMPQVYAAADFLVMTSSIEGLPFVALEALACGCPVAATDVGDLKSIIQHGESGFLVPADRTDDLAKQMAPALDNPFQLAKMSRVAREHIESSGFIRPKMLEAYRSLFVGALSWTQLPAAEKGIGGILNSGSTA
jgi:glycosyltransferase involved in cell wall biosynthesis